VIVRLLVRGLIAGLVAGLLAGSVAYVFAEPELDQAITVEAHSAAQPEPSLATRGQQKAGLIVATGLYGVSVGGLFALVFQTMRGPMPLSSDRLRALMLGLASFVVVAAVPFVKYPPNPPGTVEQAGISLRTILYLTMLSASLVSALGALSSTRHLPDSVSPVRRGALGALVFALCVGLAIALLPSTDIAPGFPAPLLWDFRATSLLTQFVLWIGLGVCFGQILRWFPIGERLRQ
jgi:predicted cobalt transporter CbtA